MRLTEVGTPVSSPDGNDAELGDDDGSTDSSRDFFGGLDTETDVSLRVSDDNNSLETGTLTGAGLFLDWLDLCGGLSVTVRCLRFIPFAYNPFQRHNRSNFKRLRYPH